MDGRISGSNIGTFDPGVVEYDFRKSIQPPKEHKRGSI